MCVPLSAVKKTKMFPRETKKMFLREHCFLSRVKSVRRGQGETERERERERDLFKREGGSVSTRRLLLGSSVFQLSAPR